MGDEEYTKPAAHPPGAAVWRAEPFRLLFPLGVVLSWIGVGHWIAYATGVTSSYSCQVHAAVQTEAFLPAFALGFLMTAIPRRTRSAPATWLEIALASLALVVVAVAASLERWAVAEPAYVVVMGLLVVFAARRFRTAGAGRRPPAAFVLIPLGLLQGAVGAAMTLARAPQVAGVGRLLVEQGTFLCLVMGAGSLLLPLMAGTPPPPDLGASPRERAKALAYAAAGVGVAATLIAEGAGWLRAAPVVRAGIVVAALVAAGAARWPRGRGLNRHVTWLAAWLIPTGLAAAGAWPDYRVPALHVLFVGGFGLLAFSVATHVWLGHLGREDLRDGWPRPVAVTAGLILLAMAARVTADWSDTYFEHLASGALVWVVASLVWLGFVGRRLVRP